MCVFVCVFLFEDDFEHLELKKKCKNKVDRKIICFKSVIHADVVLIINHLLKLTM